MSQRPCPACGTANPDDAVFCTRCGARVGGGKCECGAVVPPGGRFCPGCGKSLEGSADPEMGRREERRDDAGIRWVRGEQAVATRIAPSDLQASLRSVLGNGLEVQPGTRALLFLGGRYVGTLSPGRHTIETLFQKLKIPTDGEPVAIVVDDGELGLEFTVGGLFARDNHKVSLHAQASVRMSDPEVFLANLLRDRTMYTVADLAGFLEEEIRQSLRELVAAHAAEELYRGRVRTDLELELLSRWKATLDRTGFVLNRFRVLRFDTPGLQAAEAMRAETGDGLAVREARREGRGAFFDSDLADLRLEGESVVRLKRQTADNELEATKADVDRLERRQPVLERLLKAENVEKMVGLTSEEEWRKFRLEVDRERLLSAFEWTELWEDVAAQSASAKVKRDFLVRRLEETAKSDLDELKLRNAYALKLAEMKGDSDVMREQRARAKEDLEAELANRGRVHEQKLAERQAWFEQTRKEHAATLDAGMSAAERLSALHQSEQDKATARKLQEETARGEIERRRLAQEGEIFSSMGADQILSVAVARTPEKAAEIAEAFRAMKSGEATERERQLYERVISEVKGANERAQQLDHEKFKLSVEADARHRARREALDEQEKDRLEGVSVAGLTADDKKRIPWAYCDTHDLKYQAGRDCPMCRLDRKTE